MNDLRLGVIGCGHLGKIHARLAQQLQHATLVGFSDPNQAAREQVAETVDCPAFEDFTDLLPHIDAAIVAAPTSLHFSIVQQLLESGKHVLVEKPMTTDVEEAKQLVETAARQELVLAVGHVEQFNPTFAELRRRVSQPQFMEAVRTGGFTFRSTDVGVVFDLMIHDLDLIRSLAGSPVTEISATGFSLLSEHEDFAEARVTFANGCVAQLKASRASQTAERKLTIHSDAQRIVMDMASRQGSILTRSPRVCSPSWNVRRLTAEATQDYKDKVFTELLPVESCQLPENNPLQDEQQDFVDSIREKRSPRVSAADATESIEMALKVIAQIQSTKRQTLPGRQAA